jgi:multisubunit Na+/H+ antiporter MnhE subunit
MAQREPRGIVIPSKEELLTAARGRISLPPGELWLDYQDDVDTLYIRLKEKRILLTARAMSTIWSFSIMREKNWSESK